jgi:hypothetical protein
MNRLRLKPAFFSKLVNGKVKGIAPPPFFRIGRKQLFPEDSFEKWVNAMETNSCNTAR